MSGDKTQDRNGGWSTYLLNELEEQEAKGRDNLSFLLLMNSPNILSDLTYYVRFSDSRTLYGQAVIYHVEQQKLGTKAKKSKLNVNDRKS